MTGEYAIAGLEEVPRLDLREEIDRPLDPEVRLVRETLDTEHQYVNVWYFEPGQEMPHHAHEQQEEVIYVLEGTFEVSLGDPTDPEWREIGPGDWYAAGPDVFHGHRYTGDEEGVVLALGAPAVSDAADPADWYSLEDLPAQGSSSEN